MTSPRTSGPCLTSWDYEWCCDLLDTGAVTGVPLQAASEVLYALSGRRFDVCQLELWPCRRSCYGAIWPFGNTWAQWGGGLYPQPALIGGQWFNLTCGQCLDDCSCTPLSRFKLPEPIIDIVEVRVDNQVLVAGTDYRLDDGRFVTRLGGESWPICNDLTQVTGTGTWSVTVRYGEEPPPLSRMAVGELACEFAKACNGDDTCRLPKPVQQLTRQGVSMTFIDPNEYFKNGVVGLYFADLFINTYNPYRRQSRSKVYNIDEPEFPRLGS